MKISISATTRGLQVTIYQASNTVFLTVKTQSNHLVEVSPQGQITGSSRARVPYICLGSNGTSMSLLGAVKERVRE